MRVENENGRGMRDAGCGNGVTLDTNTSAEAGFAQYDRFDAG